MAQTQARKIWEQAWLAVLLAWIAGCVDAIGYLVLAKLFTAHMSGNSAAMGAYFGQRQWGEAWRRALPIPLFVLGVALGSLFVEVAMRRRSAHPFALALGLEGLLLVAFLICGKAWMHAGTVRPDAAWKFDLAVALPALAMGVQNAALRRVGGENVRTTYVSGMLTNTAESAVIYLFRLRDQLRGQVPRRRLETLLASLQETSLHHALLCGSIWGAFACGAILGSLALSWWHLGALALPLGGLACLIARDLWQPFCAPPNKDCGLLAKEK